MRTFKVQVPWTETLRGIYEVEIDAEAEAEAKSRAMAVVRALGRWPGEACIVSKSPVPHA